MFSSIIMFALAAAGMTAVLTRLGGAEGTSPAHGLHETRAIEPAIDLHSSLGPSEELKPRKLKSGMRTVVGTEGPYEIALRGG